MFGIKDVMSMKSFFTVQQMSTILLALYINTHSLCARLLSAVSRMLSSLGGLTAALLICSPINHWTAGVGKEKDSQSEQRVVGTTPIETSGELRFPGEMLHCHSYLTASYTNLVYMRTVLYVLNQDEFNLANSLKLPMTTHSPVCGSFNLNLIYCKKKKNRIIAVKISKFINKCHFSINKKKKIIIVIMHTPISQNIMTACHMLPK